MIDSIAMVLCIGGYGLIALGLGRTGFALSMAGSLGWLQFSLASGSVPLFVQSIFFLVLSAVGLVKCWQNS
jgi:hypothetical protein